MWLQIVPVVPCKDFFAHDNKQYFVLFFKKKGLSISSLISAAKVVDEERTESH